MIGSTTASAFKVLVDSSHDASKQLVMFATFDFPIAKEAEKSLDAR